MEGRFESYTVGRDIDLERVKEIHRLFEKHGFRIADLRSFGQHLTDEDFAEKRRLAAELRSDLELLRVVREDAASRLAAMPVTAKGVKASGNGSAVRWAALAGGAGLLGAALLRRGRRQPDNGRRR